MSDFKKALLRTFAVMVLAIGLVSGSLGMASAQDGGDGGSGGTIAIDSDNVQINGNDTDQDADSDTGQIVEQDNDQDADNGNLGVAAADSSTDDSGNVNDCGQVLVDDTNNGISENEVECENGDSSANAGDSTAKNYTSGDNGSNQAASNSNEQTGGDATNANATDQDNTNGDINAEGANGGDAGDSDTTVIAGVSEDSNVNVGGDQGITAALIAQLIALLTLLFS